MTVNEMMTLSKNDPLILIDPLGGGSWVGYFLQMDGDYLCYSTRGGFYKTTLDCAERFYPMRFLLPILMVVYNES